MPSAWHSWDDSFHASRRHAGNPFQFLTRNYLRVWGLYFLPDRRVAEREVRFIQLFHCWGDAHVASASEAINAGFKDRCQDADHPMTSLLNELEQRGMLEDTLVISGGEFGRTPMRANRNGKKMRLLAATIIRARS